MALSNEFRVLFLYELKLKHIEMLKERRGSFGGFENSSLGK